ncbi:MAG: chemotaxis protein CheY [Paenibacillaceae bacterium]|jgi:two-component system chemotaxis response regulator CheB|nr:chemotaxis protein CheY [Paenibacillaceae bacterium]
MSVKRVLVVDDSVFMRRIVSDLVAELPGFQVIATAKNGLEAIEMNERLQPDCITMDVEMPELNGLEALKRIMREHPVPVIMLSSLTREGAMETIQALEWGAVDFVQKPSGSISLDLFKVKQMLHEKLEIAVRSNIKRLIQPGSSAELSRPPSPEAAPPPSASPLAAPPSGTLPPQAPPSRPKARMPQIPLREEKASVVPPARAPVVPPAKAQAVPPAKAPRDPGSRSDFTHLVAIGTSTGGPRALQQVLTGLPENFPAPVVIVQHMPPNFTHSLAVRLNSNCRIHVVEGEDGMLLQPGTAYVAPGGFQMRVQREAGSVYRLRITSEEPRGGHRPAVDTLFESILPFTELKRHIVIMTGMGSDGAKGMLALKQQGAATTIAESEETCVVYGMPRAAYELGCVDHLLPVNEIADKLTRTLLK